MILFCDLIALIRWSWM